MLRLRPLIALLALLVLGVFMPSLASAAIPTDCTEVSPTQTGWPYAQYTFYCAGATQQNGQAMQSAIFQAPGTSQKELTRAGVVFYLYPTPAAYTADFGSKALAVGSTDFAETAFDTNLMPLYTVVFQTNKDGSANNFIPNVSAHEAGRSVDALMSYVFNGGVLTLQTVDGVLTYPSLSSYAAYPYFQNNLTKDWDTFNALSPACAATSGPNGPFYEKQDYTYTTYFCDGSFGLGNALASPYAGLASNLAVLQKSWPTTFNSTPQTFAELFASYFIATDKGGNAGGKDNFVNLSTQPCSVALMVQAVENDALGLGANPRPAARLHPF